MGAYADNDDIVPKLRAVVGRFVATTSNVKGVPSLLDLRVYCVGGHIWAVMKTQGHHKPRTKNKKVIGAIGLSSSS